MDLVKLKGSLQPFHIWRYCCGIGIASAGAHLGSVAMCATSVYRYFIFTVFYWISLYYYNAYRLARLHGVNGRLLARSQEFALRTTP